MKIKSNPVALYINMYFHFKHIITVIFNMIIYVTFVEFIYVYTVTRHREINNYWKRVITISGTGVYSSNFSSNCQMDGNNTVIYSKLNA